MSYAIEILDQDKQLVLFSSPLGSESEMKSLKDKFKTAPDNKLNFYFPKTAEARKVHNVVSRIFSTLVAFFIDLISLPFDYQNRRNNLKNKIFVYKYLKDEGVPNKFFEKVNDFDIEWSFLKDDERENTSSVKRKFCTINVHSHIGLNKTLDYGDTGFCGPTNVSNKRFGTLFSEKYCRS